MRLNDEDGFTALGFILAFIIIVAGLGFVMFAGRMALMSGSLHGAVEDGARAATIEQTVEGARSVARTTIIESLQGRQVPCRDLEFSEQLPADGDDLQRGSFVTITARCELHLRDLTYMRGMDGQFFINASATERVDVYRGETP